MMEANCVKYCVFLLCIVLATSADATDDNSLENAERKAAWSVYMGVTAESIEKAKNDLQSCRDDGINCEQKDALHYLEVAEEMVKKALVTEHSENVKTTRNSDRRIIDCSDILRMGYRKSGVYRIAAPVNRRITQEYLTVYCDMETDGGGWTVIQRRGEFNNSVDFFVKEFRAYMTGFGDLEKEFWLGNDIIYALTSQRYYSARIELEDINGNIREANYGEFSVGDERSQYTLHISNYSGDAVDAMAYANGNKFWTSDKDCKQSCANRYHGGWWFSPDGNCFLAHLNGQKYRGVHRQGGYCGILWQPWKGWDDSLDRTEIKIRPANFKTECVCD